VHENKHFLYKIFRKYGKMVEKPAKNFWEIILILMTPKPLQTFWVYPTGQTRGLKPGCLGQLPVKQLFWQYPG
jgi:hypothetical protein